MKSVCLDARKIEDGGIGTYIQNILKNLEPAHFELTLILPPYLIEKRPDLKKFQVIPCQSPPYSIQEQLQLPRLIPPCNLFWSPHFNVPLLPIRARKRLVTIHDVFHLAYFSQLKFLEKCYAKMMISRAIRLSHQIVTVSRFTEDELIRLTSVKKEKIAVIPIGVDQKLFTPCFNEKKCDEIRKKYSLPNRYFLFIGNQKAHKNFKGTVKSFSQFLLNTGADAYLILAGSGAGLRYVDDVAAVLKKFPQLEKRVVPLGFVAEKDLPFLYQFAVSLVFPSFYEGFGLPPLEAMSCHCPAIVSKVASLEEVCGDAVYYVDPYDCRTLAKGMELLWKDQIFRDSLIEKGKVHVKKFVWKDVAQKHLEFIHKVIL